jgi:N-acetyl-D-muramate 6-phosphate phosphatase
MNNDCQLEAILFDAGGVLMDVKHRPEGFLEMAGIVDAFLVKSSGVCLGEARILADLKAGAAAYSSWKYAQSRRARPREITHREFWEDFVASDWPVEALRAVAAHASDLSWKYEESTLVRTAMEGALPVLEAVKAAGLKTGIVSNTLVGGLARFYMQEYGIADLIDIQLYSDEIRLRKPNPEIFHWAATSLGVSLQNVWYLGDRLDRDVLAGRRAGVGKVILLPDKYQQDGPEVMVQADEIITKLVDLLDILPVHQ